MMVYTLGSKTQGKRLQFQSSLVLGQALVYTQFLKQTQSIKICQQPQKN